MYRPQYAIGFVQSSCLEGEIEGFFFGLFFTFWAKITKKYLVIKKQLQVLIFTVLLNLIKKGCVNEHSFYAKGWVNDGT